MNLDDKQRQIGSDNFYDALGNRMSRRDFMGGIAAGASLTGAYFGYEKLKGSPVRVGIIGTGDQGNAHIRSSNPEFLRFVAFSDIRPSNQKRTYESFTAKYGAKEAKKVELIEDYHKLLDRDDIEMVIIALPLHMHAEVTIEALAKGKHVLCEKLMAKTVKQCKEMARAARKTGKLLAIGCSVRYSPQGKQLADTKRPSQTAYAVYDPGSGTWSRWKTLEMPADAEFNFARNGCSQWLVQPDGSLLVPIYFGTSASVPSSVTVVRCGFDGRTLTYREHGTELALDVVRGLCEPSLVFFRGRYFLTIRNDVKGYVTTSDDGLHFRPITPWKFDDGSELGSYNTQQHWLAGRQGLFLAYTRRGANNDHIFRHRAPLFLARVDPQRLCVLRETEKVLIPERGATLGNFGAARIDEDQSWVTVSEYMPTGRPHARGADGSTFVARVIWSKEGSRSQ